jgi:hydrogenase/urease accessory protein HupE
LSCLFLAGKAQSHELRPAYLEIKQTRPEHYEIFWKVPAKEEGLRLSLNLRIPEHCRPLVPSREHFTPTAHIEKLNIQCNGGLAGRKIYVDGLQSTLTDVLVRYEQLDGTQQTARMDPAQPYFIPSAAPNPWQTVQTYFYLGVEHILLGIDHLLFILALLLLIRGWRRLVATVTAFTVAHSITLAAATLGWVKVPGPPVEAVIALSVVFVASEILHFYRGRYSLTEQYPWIVAFSFGLLHGLGFAGALSEVGLPQKFIPLALLFFNLGVEAGQLIFVALVLAVIWFFRKLPIRSPQWTQTLLPYAIGSIAMFWVIQRVVGFF